MSQIAHITVEQPFGKKAERNKLTLSCDQALGSRSHVWPGWLYMPDCSARTAIICRHDARNLTVSRQVDSNPFAISKRAGKIYDTLLLRCALGWNIAAVPEADKPWMIVVGATFIIHSRRGIQARCQLLFLCK